MRYGYLSALLLLVAIYPAEAGRYDDPSFLINHLLSGGVAKDGIPALTNPTFVAPDEIGYLAARRRGHGNRHQRRTASVSAQHRAGGTRSSMTASAISRS